VDPVDAYAPFPVLHERLRRGDGEAWAEFHRRYEPFLRRVARRWLTPGLRRQADTTDVVQSVFRRTLSGLPGTPIENEARLKSWLATVLRHRISRLGRRERGPGGAAIDPYDEGAAPPAPGTDPAEAAQHAETLHRLKEALDRLPRAEREAVALRDFDALSFAEVAERIGRPSPDAARKLYDRAARRLRADLGAGRERE
jgi:RNA polymerase sigma-70 factor (ECF subfamily)